MTQGQDNPWAAYAAAYTRLQELQTKLAALPQDSPGRARVQAQLRGAQRRAADAVALVQATQAGQGADHA